MRSPVAQLKTFLRLAGLELSRYRPSNSDGAQLASVLCTEGINLIFDIGANEGQFAQQNRQYGYTQKIVSFEPLSTARIRLESLASADQSWIVHDQLAIGDRFGEIEIHIAGNSVSSSVLPMLESHSAAAKDSSYIGAELVQMAKLDSVASKYIDSDTVLFIKIDTQGFEWQVLDGAADTLRQARGVLCELSLVPLYEGQRLWREVIDRLEAEGFILWGLQKGFTDPRSGQTLQMDGIFLRPSV
jgi:FkbM family methyltransferase